MVTKTWNGADAPYATDADWSPAGTPLAGDVANINSGTVTLVNATIDGSVLQVVSSSATAELQLTDATVGPSEQILVSASAVDAVLGIAGNVVNTGILDLTSFGAGTTTVLLPGDVQDAVLTNQGTIAIDSGVQFIIRSSANPTGLVNNGVVDLLNSLSATHLSYFQPAITGTGTFNLGANTLTEFVQAVGAGQTLQFGQGTATVQLDSPSQFAGTFAGFSTADTIKLAGGAPNSMSYTTTSATSGTLVLSLNGAPLETIAFSGNYAANSFALSTSAQTGVTTLSATGAAPQSVAFTPGNDSLTDISGNQLYIGNGGYDTLTINESRRGDTVSLLANGDQAITHGSQVDTVRGIADVQFLDGREVFDPNDPAAQVLRLYQAALGRAPDQAGLHQWIGNLQAGAPLSSLAAGFVGSAEFTARYGAGLSTTGFVTALYQNALGRAPDAAGLASWTSQINSGQITQAQALVGFSESAENRADTAGQVAAGIWDVSEAGAEVARLYDTVFGRLPDVGGFSGWVAALNGGESLQALANTFVTSAEFTNTYGALDNADFVSALYQNTLHRVGDVAGVANWTGALAAGSTRAQVVLGFSESAEHQANTAPNIMSSDPTQYGIRMT